MSSPRSLKIEEPSAQDWNMDASNSESNNPRHGTPHDSAVRHESASHQDSAPHHENGENGTAPPEMDESGPLLPSKTAGGPDLGVPGAKPGTIYREKQVKPNKVYVGGLPEHTRQEDLQSCFGKIGRIASIELKVGFGFVEFVDRDAAEESVAKYNEGYFMGNKIRVELSHGGGRTAKFAGEPGACFKCGQMGHWARECPNHVVTVGHRKSEPTLLDRVHAPRDIPPPASSRAYSPYRDDYRHVSSRDSRYGYDYPPPPPAAAAAAGAREPRDYRPRDYRVASPPREHRDYPTTGHPPPRQSRDTDDYRRDFRGPPATHSRYESRPGYYPDTDYPPRPSYAPQPSRDVYDSRGYDKRPPPSDRYPPYPPPGRPRTPPRARDDYDKPHPPRDYPPPEYRGRPTSPPPSRYPDSRGAIDSGRYRRRSQSPIGRSGPPYPPTTAPPISYSGNPPYPPSGNFAGGYPIPPAQGRGSYVGGGPRDRDYPPRPGRDSGDAPPYIRRP